MADHHYTECGLSNVYICGMPQEVDDVGEPIITIPRINELHHLIALGIVTHEKGITGEELRFLRTEMGLTQSELGKLVHKDKQTIGRWERSETEIDSSGEALIRRMAIEKLSLDVEVSIEELSSRSVPTLEHQVIRINCGDDEYQLQAA